MGQISEMAHSALLEGSFARREYRVVFPLRKGPKQLLIGNKAT